MALTHVCVWDPVVGFRRITVNEACKLYPFGVSARSGHFVCELCAQNVLLTAPGINVQHFRHDPSSPNKECDERQTSFDPTYGRKLQSLSSHNMPLCIELSGASYLLKLGFFHPPYQNAHCDKIIISGNSNQVFIYSFERVETAGTTYFSLGSMPSTGYEIDYVNATPELRKFWPSRVQGVSRSGSLFDCRTGQILQSGGKAYAGNSYYLLRQGPLNSYCGDVEIEHLARTQVNSYTYWYLYRIRVRRFTEESAKYFLKFSLFLTEKPTEYYPVWPTYIQDPYFIYHNSNEVYFYLCGDDAELKSFPLKADSISTDDGKLFHINSQCKEQLVSIGKSGALGFTYLVRKPFSISIMLPQVEITDSFGHVLADDCYTKPPKANQMTVSTSFDGKAALLKNGKLIYIHMIIAGQHLMIDGLTYGMEIKIFQGCDCVRSIRFLRKNASSIISETDEDLVSKLRECKGPMTLITHAIGAIANNYRTYPLVTQWIRKVIRQGEMPLAAYQLLQNRKK